MAQNYPETARAGRVSETRKSPAWALILIYLYVVAPNGKTHCASQSPRVWTMPPARESRLAVAALPGKPATTAPLLAEEGFLWDNSLLNHDLPYLLQSVEAIA